MQRSHFIALSTVLIILVAVGGFFAGQMMAEREYTNQMNENAVPTVLPTMSTEPEMTEPEIGESIEMITPEGSEALMPPATSDEEMVVCTMDAKMCPDGSFVGRSGPNCEFSACPGE